MHSYVQSKIQYNGNGYKTVFRLKIMSVYLGKIEEKKTPATENKKHLAM